MGLAAARAGLRGTWNLGLAVMALGAALLLAPSPALAEYPERTITVVVPNEAGGQLDIMARIVVKHLSKLTPQKIVIRNIVGGQHPFYIADATAPF